MEITFLSPTSLRIKGKQAAVVTNPQDKTTTYNAAVIFAMTKEHLKLRDDALLIDGPGEYEVGGLKIGGTRYDDSIVYNFTVDEVSVLLVDNKTLQKYHAKLQDMDIVIVDVKSGENPSVATNIADAAVIYTGVNAEEVVSKAVKEGVSKANKYTVTKDKLPTEVQQILFV